MESRLLTRLLVIYLALGAASGANASFTASAVVCGVYKNDTISCLTQTWIKPLTSKSNCEQIGKSLLDQGVKAFRFVRIPGPYKSRTECKETKPGQPRTIEVRSQEKTLEPMPEPPSMLAEWKWPVRIAIGAAALGFVGLWIWRMLRNAA